MSLPLLLVVLFLMGVQSGAVGPVKYAIIPQQLADDELVGVSRWWRQRRCVPSSPTFIVGAAGDGGRPGRSRGGRGAGNRAARLVVQPRHPARSGPIPGCRLEQSDTRRARYCALHARGTSLRRHRRSSWFWFWCLVSVAVSPASPRIISAATRRAVTLLLALFSIGIGAGSAVRPPVARAGGPHGAAGGDRAEPVRARPGGRPGGGAFAPGQEPDRAVPRRCGEVVFDLVMIRRGVRVSSSCPLYALVRQRSAPATARA